MNTADRCYIAVDLGASSGRVVLGRLGSNGLQAEIVHRFEHITRAQNGRLRWDWQAIQSGYKQGLNLAAENSGDAPIVSVSCSSWAQDFGLLGANGELIYAPVSYRDPRGAAVQQELLEHVPAAELLERVGVTLLPITTLVQLFVMRRQEPEMFDAGERLLHIADLVHYELCGTAVTDSTLAAASQLWRGDTAEWDSDLLARLDIPSCLLSEVKPGPTVVGAISADLGLHPKLNRVDVAVTAGHDTAAALHCLTVGEGLNNTTAFCSAGTYTMLGAFVPTSRLTLEQAQRGYACIGLTNGRYGLFASCSGLKLIRDISRALAARGETWSDAEFNTAAEYSGMETVLPLCELRQEETDDILEEIMQACTIRGITVPRDAGDFARVIFNSLAADFAAGIIDLQHELKREFRRIRILSGGSANRHLCQQVANATGLEVVAGPVEATSLGNLLLQIQLAEQLSDAEAAAIGASALVTKTYWPERS